MCFRAFCILKVVNLWFVIIYLTVSFKLLSLLLITEMIVLFTIIVKLWSQNSLRLLCVSKSALLHACALAQKTVPKNVQDQIKIFTGLHKNSRDPMRSE